MVGYENTGLFTLLCLTSIFCEYLQVLSGKIMPVSQEGTMHGSAHFCEEFLMCGGLSLITALLQRDSLPQDVDYEIRQSVYLITLQILR